MANEFKAKNGVITPFLQSTVATGTAPLVVASTTKVANLNADLLDGLDSTAFYLATNPSGYTTNAGTVTSIDITPGTGISVSGGPVTTSGTITVTNSAPNVTTDISVTHNAGTVVVNSSDGTDGTINAATTSLAGVMSATDKTKLDGIASGATANTGTVTSVSGTGTVAGLSLSGTVTTSGNLTLSGTLSTPVNTINDSTTVGQNLVKLTNPSAITFLRVNADNTVSTLDAATFRTAIGAGTSSTTGTVTSVGGTGTVSGLTLSGTVTSSGNLTLSGTLSVTPSNFASQTANTFLVAPNGTAGTPSFRTIVAADIPTLNQNTTGTAANVTGTVAVANGGTGAATLAANNVLLGNGTSAVQTVAPGANGNVLTSNGTTWVSSAPTGGGGGSGYSTTVGDGSATSFTVTHSLNKSNILVSVRENMTNGYFVYPDIKYTSVNAIILEFATAPTTNQYLVSIMGF